MSENWEPLSTYEYENKRHIRVKFADGWQLPSVPPPGYRSKLFCNEQDGSISGRPLKGAGLVYVVLLWLLDTGRLTEGQLPLRDHSNKQNLIGDTWPIGPRTGQRLGDNVVVSIGQGYFGRELYLHISYNGSKGEVKSAVQRAMQSCGVGLEEVQWRDESKQGRQVSD